MKNTTPLSTGRGESQGASSTSMPRVLIVEDEQIVARDLQIGLTNLGYAVPTTATSGAEALKLVATDPPDLVLLDIGLGGGMDGIEVGRKIHDQFDIPVVFASAYTDEETLRRAKGAVPFGFVVKPFEVRDIRSTIEMAVSKHRLERERRTSQERYRLLFQNSPVGILHFDRDMRITELNDRLGAILQAVPDDLLGQPASRVFDAKVHAAFAAALRGAPGLYQGITHRIGDKQELFVTVRTAPVRVWGGEVAGGVATVEDSTDQRKVEEALVRRVAMEELVAACAARMINTADAKLRFEIERSLEAVAGHIQADRCFVDLFSQRVPRIEESVVWSLPGEPSKEFHHPGTPLSRWPWALARLNAGHHVCLHDVADIPAEAGEDAAFWSEDGARSLLLFPLMAERRLFGAFGVAVDRDARLWGGEDLRLLALLGEVLAGVISRERSHRDVRISEERFRRIATEVTDYMYTVRLEQGHWAETVHAPGCAAVTGYTPEEYHNDPHLWLRMVDERDRAQVLEQIRRLLAGEPAEPLEHRIVRKDGQIRWVKNTPILHFTPEGDLSSYDGLIQDITERKEAADALKVSEERYRALVENLQDVVFALDARGYFVYISQRIDPLTGYTPVDVVGQHFTRFVHPHDRSGLVAAWERTLGGQLGSSEFRIMTKSGNETWVRTSSRMRFTADGTQIVTGIMTDYTPQRRVEERLRIAEQQYRELLGLLHVAAVVLDRRGSIVFCNDAALRTAGLPMDDLRGRKWYDVCVMPDQRERLKRILLEDMTEGEGARIVPVEIAGPDGSRQSTNWAVTPLRDDEGRVTGITCILHPPTDPPTHATDVPPEGAGQ